MGLFRRLSPPEAHGRRKAGLRRDRCRPGAQPDIDASESLKIVYFIVSCFSFVYFVSDFY